MFLKALKIICWPIFKILWRYKATYEAPLPKDGPVVLAGKHISGVDPILLMQTYNRPVRFMAKAELFKIPVLNLLIKAFGAFPVHRGENDINALKQSIKILREGQVLGIMPEGHRVSSIDNITLKNGAMNLAAKTKATLVPFGLYTKDYKMKIFRRFEIRYGRPIPFDEYAPQGITKEQIDELTHTLLKDEIVRLSDKNYKAGK
ncbi:MAG: 1-acyl-sn-glycerol-3-phosphate acyltransferase [Clostridia bacterium]|nr:1-acyl-sn-glycerol-3-phosphate acyltransferase [Clostridia bacterium]